ncbi:MAG: DNA-binding protein [Candidatus Thermoplasmatota archaeon]|nr:DNA-binding protein [Candidatus Thermoplasmatota archaeon]MCL5989578.1 DNA-binding protein [Candidatus Thermoplasmatota archaeon]
MDDEDELEQIRRRKLLEMQRGVQDQQELEEQKREQEAERAKRQQILRQILTPEARERLANVRLVKPDLAENVENQLIQLAGMGRIRNPLTDEDIRGILSKLTGTQRETKIERR